MIIFINPQKSDFKNKKYRFIISYYDREEKEHIEKIKNVEHLPYGKYAFTMSYIDFIILCDKWTKNTGWRVCLHAEDFHYIFSVHPIKVSVDRRKKDIEELLKLDQ